MSLTTEKFFYSLSANDIKTVLKLNASRKMDCSEQKPSLCSMIVSARSLFIEAENVANSGLLHFVNRNILFVVLLPFKSLLLSLPFRHASNIWIILPTFVFIPPNFLKLFSCLSYHVHFHKFCP